MIISFFTQNEIISNYIIFLYIPVIIWILLLSRTEKKYIFWNFYIFYIILNKFNTFIMIVFLLHEISVKFKLKSYCYFLNYIKKLFNFKS